MDLLLTIGIILIIYLLYQWLTKEKSSPTYIRNNESVSVIPKVCSNCGTTNEVQTHHKVPISLGGTDDPNNLVDLCVECHQKHHGYKFRNKNEYVDDEYRCNRSEKTKIINQAIRYNRKVRILYQSDQYLTHVKEKTERVISPINIYEENRRIYIKAFCHLRNAERVFRLSRIKKIELL